MVGARLHRHVERRTARTLAGGLERDDLAVPPAGASVAPSPTISSPATTTAPTVGFGYALPRAASASSSARSRLMPELVRAGGRRGRGPRAAKMPLPTTSRSAPASCTCLTLSCLTPPSTCTKQSTSVAQPLDPLVRVLHELLAGVAGHDRHAEAEVRRPVRGLRRHLDVRPGVEGDADLEPVLARLGDHAGDVVRGLDVEGDAVAARLRDLREVVRRVVDHQVAVDATAVLVDHRSDRAQHDGADRHRRDEVAVADVEVEDARARVQQVLDLLAEPREVRRVQRRLDLDRPHPVLPGHARDLRRGAAR